MKTNLTEFAGIDGLCRNVMVATANLIRGKTTDYEKATRVMREEIMAFVMPEGNDYSDERECVLRGSLHDSVIVASIAARCAEKILN